MSSSIANAQFLRRLLGCFIVATTIAGVAASYVLLAVGTHAVHIDSGHVHAWMIDVIVS